MKLSWLAGSSHEVRQICLDADVGITGAQAALAETGSVALYSGAGRSRLVSLLPDVHIVLLPAELIVPDLITWEAVRPEILPEKIVFISGPSKTADIEQTLVVGAHGPKRFEVIIYGKS